MNFHPGEYGLVPVVVCTACWRGFYCVYQVKDKYLYLDDLYISCENDAYPELFGVKAEPSTSFGVSFYRYKGLNHMMKFNGSIVIGTDFIQNYYVHMGYQSAWAYRRVWELKFKDGELIKEIDHSRMVQNIRDRMDKKIYEHYRPFCDAIHRNAPAEEIESIKAKVDNSAEESFLLELDVKAWWI